MQRLLQRRGHRQQTRDEEVHLFSDEKVKFMARLIAVTVTSTILLIPVLILSLVAMSGKAASIVVLVSVLAFAILMSSFSGARLEGLFIGTCA